MLLSIAALLAMSGCGGSSKTASTQTSSASHTASTASTATQTTATQTTATQPAASATTGATANTVSASAGGVTATLHATTHHPKVQVRWPIQFTVTRAGHAVSASVAYEYLFGGQVVAHRSHYTFSGHFSDVFEWPATAVGYPLTFRAVIVSDGVTIDLDYPVQVSG